MNKYTGNWEEDVLTYLEENKGRMVSIFEMHSMHGLVSASLLEAVEKLERGNKIEVVWDANNKKWLKHKEISNSS